MSTIPVVAIYVSISKEQETLEKVVSYQVQVIKNARLDNTPTKRNYQKYRGI
jgi:hypothetical protein